MIKQDEPHKTKQALCSDAPEAETISFPMSTPNLNASQNDRLSTLISLLFVVNYEFKCSANYIVSIRMHATFGKVTKSHMHEKSSFVQSTQIQTHEYKWIHRYIYIFVYKPVWQ